MSWWGWEQWLDGDIFPPLPAAVLTGVLDPTCCPSSVATTSSWLSPPPLPPPWWPSGGIPPSIQLHGEAGLLNCPWSPCVLLPLSGGLQPSPGLCTCLPSLWPSLWCPPNGFMPLFGLGHSLYTVANPGPVVVKRTMISVFTSWLARFHICGWPSLDIWMSLF